MRIYHDIKRLGFQDTIYILQRALTFVYEDYLLEPEVTFETNRFRRICIKNKEQSYITIPI